MAGMTAALLGTGIAMSAVGTGLSAGGVGQGGPSVVPQTAGQRTITNDLQAGFADYNAANPDKMKALRARADSLMAKADNYRAIKARNTPLDFLNKA